LSRPLRAATALDGTLRGDGDAGGSGDGGDDIDDDGDDEEAIVDMMV
jgi:hypothetical protein